MPMPKASKIAIGGLTVVALGGAAWTMTNDEGASARQTTDNAYVQADFSTVSPRVNGTIANVLVEDNQTVKRGDLLAIIDDRDFRVALSSAEADLKIARANVAALTGQLERQDSVIAQASAAIDESRAAVSLAEANAQRYGDLAQDGSASRQEQQEAASRLDADRAATAGKRSAFTGARDQLPILRAQLEQAKGQFGRAQAAVDAARLNLSYTRIRAPIDGVVGQRTVRVGNVVQAGRSLLAVVPVSDLYVEARYRENQMTNIRAGQGASVRIDALPDLVFKRKVESIAPATGISYAEVAPANLSGNFTKIAQRLAVRISISGGQPGIERLRVGMSAVPTVATRN